MGGIVDFEKFFNCLVSGFSAYFPHSLPKNQKASFWPLASENQPFLCCLLVRHSEEYYSTIASDLEAKLVALSRSLALALSRPICIATGAYILRVSE